MCLVFQECNLLSSIEDLTVNIKQNQGENLGQGKMLTGRMMLP